MNLSSNRDHCTLCMADHLLCNTSNEDRLEPSESPMTQSDSVCADALGHVYDGIGSVSLRCQRLVHLGTKLFRSVGRTAKDRVADHGNQAHRIVAEPSILEKIVHRVGYISEINA